MIRNAKLLEFSPQGLTDAYDETSAFPGACRSLSNFIFSSSSHDRVVARPGVGLPLTTFATFSAAGFISIQQTIGDITYGMIASSRNAGFDEPFAFNNITQTFITITGVTSANVPTSPASSGAWTPPTMASVAKKLIITHPGFSGVGSNFFGVLDISNPSAPAWSSSNTSTNLLPSVPTSVANYNNRAYYAIGNQLYGSDSLSPLVITNLNSTLTIGDVTNVTAQIGLPLQTTSSGITSALIVFKANSVWMVTGDTVGGTLTLGFLSLTVGCPHPRSVAQTPIGTIFVSQDAPYLVTGAGTVAELRHPSGMASDVRTPFQNSTMPTRTAGAFAGNIYRVCVITIIDGANVTNDYWFDIRRMRWSGPHTFTYDCASQHNNSFIVSGVGTGAALFNSPSNDASLSSIYTDNGIGFQSTLTFAFVHSDEGMEFKQTVESSLDVASGGLSANFAISANDADGDVIASANVVTGASAVTWGTFHWGDGTLYQSAINTPRRYDVAWNVPIVWDRLSISISVTSASLVTIGKFKAKYQDCGYSLRPVTLSGILPPNLPPAGNRLDTNFILDQSSLS